MDFLYFIQLILLLIINSSFIFAHTSKSKIEKPIISRHTSNKQSLVSKIKRILPSLKATLAPIKFQLKDWNFIVYMAANNNLHRFALHNFRQMLRIGSTDHINILLQIDEFGESEVTRFYIEQNNATIYETISNTPEAISGTPESLYGFLRWAIKTFPAKHHAVLLWNHGSGVKDPSIWGKYYGGNRNKFFQKNQKTGLMQLKRKTSQDRSFEKGIAFNEIHQTYITNQELRSCLEKTCTELLDDTKIDIIFMDACHMSMIEIASELKNLTNYMVGSEEIEPGTGYNYTFLLEPFLQRSLLPSEFAKHAVVAYEAEYTNAFADFTQAAVSLHNFNLLEEKLATFSQLLLQFLNSDADNFSMLRRMRKSMRDTTEFFDEDYIDLRHFLKSLITLLQSNKNAQLHSKEKASLASQLELVTFECITELDNKIIASTTGVNLVRAGGLGLYYPKKMVHHSYLKTLFAQVTQWSDFLAEFAKKNREY